MAFFWYNSSHKTISTKRRDRNSDMSVLKVLSGERPYWMNDRQADKFGKYVAALLNKYYEESAAK